MFAHKVGFPQLENKNLSLEAPLAPQDSASREDPPAAATKFVSYVPTISIYRNTMYNLTYNQFIYWAYLVYPLRTTTYLINYIIL